MRFDLKEDLDLEAAVVGWMGLKSRASSSSAVVVVINGWFPTQFSRTGCDRGDSFRMFMLDLRLRIDSGVAGLPKERSERSSASSEGMESLEADRSYSGRLYRLDCQDGDRDSSDSSARSKSMLRGLLS